MSLTLLPRGVAALTSAALAVALLSVPVASAAPGDVLTATAAPTAVTEGLTTTVTGRVTTAAAIPVAGRLLGFEVVSGPNAGLRAPCVSPKLVPSPACLTGASGTASFTYRGAGGGSETVRVFVDDDADGTLDSGETSRTTTLRWREGVDLVSLGDSYATGQGLSPTFPVGADGCTRATGAHPARVVAPGTTEPIRVTADPALNTSGVTGSSFVFRACATDLTDDIRTAQVPSITSATDLVLLSAGAGDILDPDRLGVCLLPDFLGGACGQSLADDISARTAALVPKLDALLAAAKARNPSATVVITTYPQLFVRGGPVCGNTNLDVNERTIVFDATARLNSVITDAARTAGVHVVDVAPRFVGHDVCAATPWLENIIISGTTADPRSLHPNATGQQELAAELTTQLATRTPVVSTTGLPANPGPTDSTETLQAARGGSCGSGTAFAPGAAVTLTGVRFAPGAGVAIERIVGATTTSLGTSTATSAGAAVLDTVLPDITATTVAFRMSGANRAGRTNTASVTLRLNPIGSGCIGYTQLAPTPGSGITAPGGTGFTLRYRLRNSAGTTLTSPGLLARVVMSSGLCAGEDQDAFELSPATVTVVGTEHRFVIPLPAGADMCGNVVLTFNDGTQHTVTYRTT